MLSLKSRGLPYIRDDPISRGLFFLSVGLSLFIAVAGADYNDFSLGIAGLVQLGFSLSGQLLVNYAGISAADKQIANAQKISRFGTYSIIAIAIYSLSTVAVPSLLTTIPLAVIPSSVNTTSTITIVFLVNEAIAEEKFFRAFWTNLLMKSSQSTGFAVPVGILGSAVIFTIFHLFAEGGNSIDLGIIFIGGITLAAIDVISQHELPSLIAHMVINFIASIYLAVVGLNLSAIGLTVFPHLLRFVGIK